MSDSQFINVTPHPRILGVLGDIEFAHWQCVAELVDNSFDEFQAAGNAVGRPAVSITLPAANASRSTAGITVKDNGRGMSLDAITNAISAGWTSNGRYGSLGLFGMGFNISTARLGRHTTVRSSRAGDPHWVEVVLDLPRIAESAEYRAPYRLVPKNDIAEHGTTVTISDLKTDQFETLKRPRTQTIIREKLGDIYSYLLRERGFLLTINNKKVEPRLPCLWDETRHVTRRGVDIRAVQQINVPLKVKKACLSCGHWNAVEAETCEECGQERLQLRERQIWGWIGVQRYVHRSDYGLDFMRNGRKILLKDKRVFTWQDEDELTEPELEYPIDSKSPTGRIVGEIHCDHVTPNYQKNAFEFDTHEWRQVLHSIRGSSPLRPIKAKDLGLPENTSPLAQLYAGYRRQDPGLNYLIPGDGNRALHEKAIEWADKFRRGDQDYRTDQKWYDAAYQHDHPVTVPPAGEDDDEILPGVGNDLPDPKPATSGSAPGGTPVHTDPPTPPVKEPTLAERLQSYREAGEQIVDLAGPYTLKDLGSIELVVWAVRSHDALVDSKGNQAPVVAFMARPPRLEIFVNVTDDLFQAQGTDVRDLALVEAAEFLRVRANSTSTPLTGLVRELKAISNIVPLTPHAMADEAERVLNLVRSGMVAYVAEDPSTHWDLLTEGERADAEQRYAIESANATKWEEKIADGDFVRYLPANAVVRIITATPEKFLDGKVFNRPFRSINNPNARELVVERLINPLSDLALLEQHRPRLDIEELTRTRSSCRLVVRALADTD
ncbi:ATP-binding protein [Lentzea cavernae]|uniref:ATP-binding protein n=1 Tax=Lentzea cavernae TaxID=2020703 RepID=A0ABQ3MKK6_9PSEU|nr:ATP-binding protein [Lentzea cavernae]GHH46431.1 hypothetical protein GCM10017774_49350 [Lentzea cavernae]